jgi:hypothetical protein
VLAAVAERFGIPVEGPDLPGRIVAHARIGVNYRIGAGETAASAAERIATLNTDAALTRDVKVIGGKTSGTKLDKAKQLVKRAQEIEAVMKPAPEAAERSNLDTEYLAAVEAGDMTTAQRMVDEAAKRAGYTTPRLFRGSVEDDGVILPKSFEAGGGIFLTDNEDVAGIFTYPREYGEVITSRYDEDLGEDVDIEPGPVLRAYARLTNPLTLTRETTPDSEDFVRKTGVQSRTIKSAQAAGHDGIVVKDTEEGVGDWMEEGTTYVVFEPNQVKSAEPVTRDDAGNVIPLSKRFNPQSPDIRESIGDALPSTPGNVTSPYEQVRQGGNEAVGGDDTGAAAGGVPQVGGVAGVPAGDSVRPGQQPAQARRDAARRLAGAGHPAWQDHRDLARELGVPALDKHDPYFAHPEFPERGVESVIFDASDTRGVLIKASDPFAAVGVADGPAHAILREYISQNDPAFVPTTIKGVTDMRSAVRIVMEQPFLELHRQPPAKVAPAPAVPAPASPADASGFGIRWSNADLAAAQAEVQDRNEALRTLGLFPTSQYGVSAISYATGEFFRIQDLNKGNVLFDPTGAPHIIDFVADPMTDVEAGYAIVKAITNGVATANDIPPSVALPAVRAAQQESAATDVDALGNPTDSIYPGEYEQVIAAFEAQQRSSLGDEIVTTTIDGTERQMPARLAEKRAKGLDYTLRKLADCLVKR